MSEHAPQRSWELFQSGLFCAESVLLAIAESQGIHSDLIPRIATGFCSGVSRTGGMCGAVSGAIMGIDLVAGRNSPAGSLEANYALTQKLISRFERQYGSINCCQLIGCDLATEAGQQYFMENHLMESCLQYAEAATAILTYGFEVLQLHRIYARYFTRNHASGRIMQKLGMTFEGIQREHFYKGDRFEDVAHYGILRQQWKLT
jgi:C_GCAxxG_C_C family probable redox protein